MQEPFVPQNFVSELFSKDSCSSRRSLDFHRENELKNPGCLGFTLLLSSRDAYLTSMVMGKARIRIFASRANGCFGFDEGYFRFLIIYFLFSGFSFNFLTIKKYQLRVKWKILRSEIAKSWILKILWISWFVIHR